MLVTGASRGLGKAMAEAFARRGAFVFVGCRTGQQAGREVVASLRGLGGDGALLPFDVRDEAHVDAAVRSALEQRPTLDVLVNNAGVMRDGFFAMMPKSDWSEVVGTNLDGAFHVCRAAVRAMMRQRSGAIVNVASLAGAFPSVGQANYAASKGGLVALTQTLAAELGPRGIRVNAVLPGLCASGMGLKMDRRLVEARKEHIPLGRLGTAEEVAETVVFLASPESSYITGQALRVDGGLAS